MRIAVVDDNEKDAEYLKSCILRCGMEQNETFEVTVYPDAESFLRGYQYNFDLVILDIDMPGRNGVEAARALREHDESVALMFVTNMPQYALEGFSVDAVDYILKPISYPNFRVKMQKALRYVERNRDYPISLKTTQGYVKLMVSDIRYIESELHYLTFHTKSGDYRIRGLLSGNEALLAPYHFSRCNASYLVNLRYVEAIKGNDVIVAGSALPISRGRKASFLSDFTKYMGGIQ